MPTGFIRLTILVYFKFVYCEQNKLIQFKQKDILVSNPFCLT